MKLTLSSGVVAVLQLDDEQMRVWYQITEVTWLSKSIRFETSTLGLVRLMYSLRERAEGAAGMFDQPRGYTRSARAAFRQIARQVRAKSNETIRGSTK